MLAKEVSNASKFYFYYAVAEFVAESFDVEMPAESAKSVCIRRSNLSRFFVSAIYKTSRI
jgi:hypothetical protein